MILTIALSLTPEKLAWSGEADATGEIKSAMRRGMRVTRLGLMLTAGQDETSFVLDGSFRFRSVKLPKDDAGENDEYMRMTRLGNLMDTVDRLLEEFQAAEDAEENRSAWLREE